MTKVILKPTLILLILLASYFLFWPVGFEPVAYSPPDDPGLNGDFAVNDRLSTAEAILLDQADSPEAVAYGPDSMFYSGLVNGDIIRYRADGSDRQLWANTGGRPLGMKFDAHGKLIIADEKLGLISVDSTGEITILVSEVDGKKLYYTDDLDIARDGIIYFSDATQRNKDVVTEIWELQPTGRLLSYNPATQQSAVLLDSMRFANGVAVGPDDEYLLISETFGMVINKVWLKGPKKGQAEIWVDSVPGFPDNITYNDRGIFWLAMPDLRIGKHFEKLYDQPFLRKVVARLPTSITGAEEPKPYGLVIGFDLEGRVVHNLQDPSGNIRKITSALDINGTLYLGSLAMNKVMKYTY